MSTTTSFRLPQAIEIPEHIEHEGRKIPVPPQIRQNVRILLNGLLDSNQAVASLKSQLTALQAKVNSISPSTTNISTQNIGGVNDQTNAAAVTLQNGDQGSIVVVNNGGVGVPVTLNSSVNNLFFTKVTNNGSVAATLTPDTTYPANVISAASPTGSPSFSLGSGQTINLFFNSVTKNWYAFA